MFKVFCHLVCFLQSLEDQRLKKQLTHIQRYHGVYWSLTKNSQALGENISRTGFTSAFCCSISTFRLRELTKSGVSYRGSHIKTNQEITIKILYAFWKNKYEVI